MWKLRKICVKFSTVSLSGWISYGIGETGSILVLGSKSISVDFSPNTGFTHVELHSYNVLEKIDLNCKNNDQKVVSLWCCHVISH